MNQSLFKKYAEEHKFDICAAVDGDGDRLVLADADGIVFDGDDILYLLAKSNLERNVNGSNAVVGTDMTNQGVADALAKHNIDLIRLGKLVINISLRELVEEIKYLVQRHLDISSKEIILKVEMQHSINSASTAIQESGISLKEVSSEISKQRIIWKVLP